MPRGGPYPTKLTPEFSKGVCERRKDIIEQIPLRFCKTLNSIVAFIMSQTTLPLLYSIICHGLCCILDTLMPRKLLRHPLQAVVCMYTSSANDPAGRLESVQAGYLGMSRTMYPKPAALHTSDRCLGNGTTGTFVPMCSSITVC